MVPEKTHMEHKFSFKLPKEPTILALVLLQAHRGCHRGRTRKLFADSGAKKLSHRLRFVHTSRTSQKKKTRAHRRIQSARTCIRGSVAESLLPNDSHTAQLVTCLGK